MKTEYQIAFVSGGWGEFAVVETFEAQSDDAANAYAESEYADQEWYVLRGGKNINA